MRDVRICFFGDSFVTGFGDETGLGWVGRVTAASVEAGVPITAYNLGVRGQTSEEVGARWLAEAEARLDPEVDNRVVFSFGANDISRPLGQEASLEALAAPLDGARERGIQALVVGPAPLGDERDERIAELSAAYEDLCRARDVPFVSIVDELRSSSAWRDEAAAGDGAHPGSGGYSELARLVLAGGWLDWLRTDDD